VSCIMPTFNRRHFVSLAIKCYQSQDWLERELVVVDDGSDCVKDLCDEVSSCRYFRTEKFKTLGEKVNYCCEQTRGEIIVTWDDDDWYAPNRITDQVTRLIESGKSVSGYHTIMFYDGKRASQYRGSVNYATGSSQVYRKDFWEKHRFESVNVGYDTTFSNAAQKENGIVSVDGSQMLVARIHDKNISGPRSIGCDQWGWMPTESLPGAYFACAT
jgi:glycosyltransferase involved in cell wall biosynthesis